MKRRKKFVAIILGCVMIMGATLTAHAADCHSMVRGAQIDICHQGGCKAPRYLWHCINCDYRYILCDSGHLTNVN